VERKDMSESYADEETFKQIRARRAAEFAAKYPDGMPSDKRVWPWWMIRIEELKARVKELEQQVEDQDNIIIELGEMDDRD
jgi:hypothetical protein